MKTVALADLSARREELLGGLAQGDTFAVTDAGERIATLIPSSTPKIAGGNASVFDLMADLIGTADGPPDLSNKKKHLVDFGLDGPQRREPA